MVLVFPFPFSPPKPCSQAGRRSRQLTLVPAHVHAGVSRKPSPASRAQGTGVCSCPSLGGDLLPCSVKAWGQPTASHPHELRSTKSRSYFWRAASLGAEAAELGCTDRKRKALVFRTQSEVSQPPAREDGRHPCKNKRGLQRSVAGGLQMSSKAISIKL